MSQFDYDAALARHQHLHALWRRVKEVYEIYGMVVYSYEPLLVDIQTGEAIIVDALEFGICLEEDYEDEFLLAAELRTIARNLKLETVAPAALKVFERRARELHSRIGTNCKRFDREVATILRAIQRYN